MSPSNIRYINQTGPFWDWVASIEDSAAEHPWFGGGFAGPSGHPHGPPPPPGPHGPPPPGPPPPHHGPWWGPWGRRHNWHGHLPHHGPPQPPPADGEEPPSSDEKRENPEDPVADPPEETPQPPREGGPGRRGRGGRCGGGDWRGHGHGRGFGGRHHHHHGHPYARGWGFPGRGGFGMLSELFSPAAEGESSDNDWKPEADVFDTEGSYVVHLSLPGANKEDIGVSWDSEKSELTVSGVVHRPGDEEFLKTLALDERKVGAFERKVRLGTRANPAQVDVDGITAKLENGILLIDVPKLNGEYVEIKKVDIE